ncbi:MAG TPA: hypothetical protein VGC45_07900 [Gryllotalpicola sp.]
MPRHRQTSHSAAVVARYRRPALLGGLIGGATALVIGAAAFAFVLASEAGVDFSFSDSAAADVVGSVRHDPAVTHDLAAVTTGSPTPIAHARPTPSVVPAPRRVGAAVGSATAAVSGTPVHADVAGAKPAGSPAPPVRGTASPAPTVTRTTSPAASTSAPSAGSSTAVSPSPSPSASSGGASSPGGSAGDPVATPSATPDPDCVLLLLCAP